MQESPTLWYYPNNIGGGIGYVSQYFPLSVELSVLSVSYQTSFLYTSDFIKRIQDDVTTHSVKIPLRVGYKIFDFKPFEISVLGGYQLEFSSRTKGHISSGSEALIIGNTILFESKYSTTLHNTVFHFAEIGADLSVKLSKKVSLYNRFAYQYGLTAIYSSDYTITDKSVVSTATVNSNGNSWNYNFGLRFYIK